ncbi:MAG: ScyD/ScyE family protein [Thermus sp.]
MKRLAMLGMALGLGVLAQGLPVITGLNGPMGLLFAPDGRLYVVEYGLGGDTQVEMVNPETGERVAVRVGQTSRVLRLEPEGSVVEVARFPSVAFAQESSGASRLAWLGGLLATSGGWNIPEREPMPLMAVVARVGPGGPEKLADLWAFEKARNPDGHLLDSHPYGLTVAADGYVYVADAGANALLKVNPTTGAVSVVAVFAGLPAPFANPARKGAMEMDPVPTAVVAKNGVFYVSLLSGAPFPHGAAKVVKVEGGQVSDYATGATMLTDLQEGPDGQLYAVRMAETGERGPIPATGAVLRVRPGGFEEVVGGLPFPTALAITPSGDLYVTVNGVGAPGSGAVWKFPGASPQSTRLGFLRHPLL